MRPQDRLAALKALQHGLSEAISRAEREIENVREQTGAKQFDTELGTVSVAVMKSKVILPDADLVRWCEQNGFEHEIVRSLRPSFRRAISERFVIERGDKRDCVIDSKTGEEIDWAIIQASSGEYVRTLLTPEAKARAAQSVALDRLPVLWLAEVQEVEQ